MSGLLILAADSTSKTASAAIMEDGKLLYEGYLNNGLTHSETLGLLIEEGFHRTGHTAVELTAIAVTNGPGSFTGVRIGVCLVKGLAAPSSTPVIPFSTLEALALGQGGYEGTVLAVLDARRNQYYHALFEIENGRVTRLTQDAALSHEAVEEDLKNRKKSVLLVGDGAQMCYNKMKEKDRILLASPSTRFVRAGALCAAAEDRLSSAVPAESLTVSYLRLSQAERERQEKQNETGKK